MPHSMCVYTIQRATKALAPTRDPLMAQEKERERVWWGKYIEDRKGGKGIWEKGEKDERVLQEMGFPLGTLSLRNFSRAIFYFLGLSHVFKIS